MPKSTKFQKFFLEFNFFRFNRWDCSVPKHTNLNMTINLFFFVILSTLISLCQPQNIFYGDVQYNCPKHWIKFQESCYRFVKSPLKRREDARRTCQAYESDLLSINSMEEHGFILQQLLWQDPQHRTWYTGNLNFLFDQIFF